MDFLEFLGRFRESDIGLVEAIELGYRVCFEGYRYVETPIDIRDLYANQISDRKLNEIYDTSMDLSLEDMLLYAEDMGLSDRYRDMTVFGKFVMDLYRVRKLQEDGVTESMVVKFSNFLESIKESDPTLVESLQEAFATCFMESDETQPFFDEAYFNKEKARIISDYSDVLPEQRLYALVEKLLSLPSHEEKIQYIHKIGLSDDPNNFTMSGQFINEIYSAYEDASKE